MTRDLIETQLCNKLFSIDGGDLDALPFYVDLKYFIKLFTEAKDQLEDQAINEFERYQEKTVDFKKYEITLKEGSRRFNYNNVRAWKEMKKQVAEIEKKSRLAYELGDGVVVESTGEIIEPAELEFSKQSLTIKFKK